MVGSDTSLNYLLRNRDFLFFIIGRFSNVVGVQILTVAVGWHVYQLTGDPLDLGYIGLAQFLQLCSCFSSRVMCAINTTAELYCSYVI